MKQNTLSYITYYYIFEFSYLSFIRITTPLSLTAPKTNLTTTDQEILTLRLAAFAHLLLWEAILLTQFALSDLKIDRVFICPRTFGLVRNLVQSLFQEFSCFEFLRYILYERLQCTHPNQPSMQCSIQNS